MHSPQHTLIPRRDWLAGALSVLAVGGCRPEPETMLSDTESVRTDVPLRVVWVGDASDAEVLQRTWTLISEQPLDVRVVASPRQRLASMDEHSAAPPPEFGADLSGHAAAADVVIYPLAAMSELVAKKRLMPLLKPPRAAVSAADAEEEEEMSGIFAGSTRGSVPVALRVATTYRDELLAKPLGGYLPALLLGEDASETAIASWADYESFVESSAGKCCEPTAAGWAGCMYLWRLASSLSASWLFERESLRPLFSEPEYVAVLEQMASSVKKSIHADQGLSPNQIYEGVASGELLGGIGFPQPWREQAPNVTVSLAALPGTDLRTELSLSEDSQSLANRHTKHHRGMLDPFMLVGSLTAACRQTAAASVFLDWIAGGQGSETLYRETAVLIDTTTVPNESSANPFEKYRDWVIAQSNRASFVPTLNLPGAIHYYRALDETVRACVHGDLSAQDAGAEITERWMRLHHEYDLASQRRAWRRAQGI